MRKHFLLLFLMALLPLSGWAVSFLDETVTVSADDAAFNTAIATIKDGITVKINNEPLDEANWDWDGKFYATATAAAAEDPSGQVAAATGSTTPGVNTYYIRIVPTTAANSDYKVIPLIIRKANILAADVTAPVGYTGGDALTYINQSTAQKLIKTAGSCAWGTLQYRLGTTGSWVTNKDEITATNADTYAIYYRVVADDNHNDFPPEHPHCDSFGCYTMILPETFTYDGIIRAMETGDMYASMGPRFREVSIEDGRLHVECSDVRSIFLHNGGKKPGFVHAAQGDTLTSADFTIPQDAKYIRVSLTDWEGMRADTRGFFPEEIGLAPQDN